jgi:transcriptional regulator with XRE-family HTH domain
MTREEDQDVDPAPGRGQPDPGVIAQRLEHLFAQVHPPGRGPYSNREAADAINSAAGRHVLSASYLWQLRTGVRTDPAHSRLSALARFFGVLPQYFYDAEDARRADEQLTLLALLRDDRIRHLALSARDLPGEQLQVIALIIAWARRDAGLPPLPGPGPVPAP